MVDYQKRRELSLSGIILVFMLFLMVGYFFGVTLAIFMFALLSSFLGAISTLLGTFLAISVILVLLVYTNWSGYFKVAFYGLMVGVLISLILANPMFMIVGESVPQTIILFLFPLSIVLAVIILTIIYAVCKRYKIVKKKDIMLFEDKNGAYRSYRRKRKKKSSRR